MIPVSLDFKVAAKATVRKPKAKVVICWTDPFIDTTIQVSANSVNRGARLFQVADIQTDVPVKWFHLDGNCKVNGIFKLMPSTDAEARKTQVGWWGANRCGADCTFSSPYEQLTLTFTARPVQYIYVHGDNTYNEYPVNFNVYLYTGETLSYTLEVTDNSQISFTASVVEQNLTSITKMILEIRKWSTAYRVVKISEFYTTIIFEYTGDDIKSLSILEEMELTNGSLPVGNISSNEIDLSLINIDDKFFPGNTEAVLHNLMKRNRRIKAYLGFELIDGSIEYAPMGTFWSGDWNTPELGTTASTSGRDRLDLLRKMDFSASAVYTNKSLYDLAVIVCEDAFLYMPDLRYWVDPDLKNFVIPNAWFPKKNYMETIRGIVEACLGFAYMNRYDVLIIGRKRTSTPEEPEDTDNNLPFDIADIVIENQGDIYVEDFTADIVID